MLRQVGFAAGYLSIFLMPALLALGVWSHHPYLAFGTTMLVFPLARGVFGGYKRVEPTLWNEHIATVLERLPVAYGVALLASTIGVIAFLANGGIDSPTSAIGVGLSLWMTMLFATCPAHELVHRRNPHEAKFGWMIAGLAGYPPLGLEHLIHHGRYGDTQNAEWPRVDESVWQFAGRRMRRVLVEACVLFAQVHGRGSGAGRHLTFAVVVTLVTLTAFALAGGVAGFLIYLGVAIGVTFGVQVITYLQHWGLGDDSLVDAARRQLAWEDDCLFQAWVTLHISFHQSHHDSSRLPYYRVALAPGSPRQPAGYVLLMLLCMLPRLWQRSMRPVLDEWKRQPDRARSPGRRLTCFALYGRAG
ncbi:MAG: fatty acid desaturase [Ideonella sp.]|nr:fatty acid desaturase [Ideonella sp.]